MVLYGKKDGKKYKVPHAVDAREWLATGDYTEKKPNSKKVEATPSKSYASDGEKYKDLVTRLDTLLADDVKFVAARLGITYVTKDEAVVSIKARLGIE